MKDWKIPKIEIQLSFEGNTGAYKGGFEFELEDDLSVEFTLSVSCKLVREEGYEPSYENIEVKVSYLRRIQLSEEDEQELINQIKEQVVWS